MAFLRNLRFLVNNVTEIVQRLSASHHQQALPALCMDIHGNTDNTRMSPQDVINSLLDPVLYAVPRNRRTIEKRLTRKHNIPAMRNALPKNNIVFCLTCGSPHEVQTICGKCYSEVRKHTEVLKKAMGEKTFYYDQPNKEVAFVYENEKNLPMFKGRKLIEVPNNLQRPSKWFPEAGDKSKKDN